MVEFGFDLVWIWVQPIWLLWSEDSFGPGIIGANLAPLVPRLLWSRNERSQFGSFGPRTHLVPGWDGAEWLLRIHLVLWTHLVLWIHLVPFNRGVRGHFYFRGSFGPFLPLVLFGPKECEGQRKRSPSTNLLGVYWRRL